MIQSTIQLKRHATDAKITNSLVYLTVPHAQAASIVWIIIAYGHRIALA